MIFSAVTVFRNTVLEPIHRNILVKNVLLKIYLHIEHGQNYISLYNWNRNALSTRMQLPDLNDPNLFMCKPITDT